MHKLLSTLFFTAATILAASAGATVLTGTIRNIDGDKDGRADDERVARITFDVTAGTRVFFDTLVIEGPGKDLNHDGFITGFDSILTLYQGTTRLVRNDDSGLTFGDGSINSWDSAFEYTFAQAGTYTLAIGKRDYTDLDAQRGYVLNRNFVPLVGSEHWAAWQLGMTVGSGKLSAVTLFDADAAVPEPGSLTLFGAGVLGAALLRRRRAMSRNG
jgi:hypothetical protein